MSATAWRFLCLIVLSIAVCASTAWSAGRKRAPANSGASTASKAQKGTIIGEAAFVYKEADFDSAVITTLKQGQVYDISKTKKGAFYKIRIKPGQLGWIVDSDIRVGALNLKKVAERKQLELRRKRPFSYQRHRGLALEYMQFAEDTRGQNRYEGLLFYGLKISGNNTFFEGETYTDSTLQFHFGAPKYYKEATGFDADGWIFMGQFLFITPVPQSRWHMLYYGFGPNFRYSHFDLKRSESGREISYAADDMVLGAVFNLGLAFRLNPQSALRSEVKYYWEKTKYFAFSTAYQFEF
ncbi:MAG: SH3 domain-containing protein [Pseudobdellovibrionaceae bacterium]